MDDAQRAAMERAAIAQFMGQLYGEAKQLDRDMISRSATLKPTSQIVEQALREHLQSQKPTFIPPAGQEFAQAQASAGGNSTGQPYGLPQGGTPIEQPITLPQQAPQAPIVVSNVEILQRLDIIITKLSELLGLFGNINQDETTSKEG